MAYQPGVERRRPPTEQGAALAIVRIGAGTYLFFIGLHKIGWLFDSGPLAAQLSSWLSHATLVSRWYLERILPGTPIFARLVPIGEMTAGLALVLGFWTRLAAACAFLMVLNYQVADGAVFHYTYLSDATGLPYLAALLGLAIGGAGLPLSVRK